jgi:peptidyl-prolyl cis-trans isomerase C
MNGSSSLVSLGALVLLLAACDGAANPTGGASRSTAPAASSAGRGDDVLATVNGVPIRASEVHYAIARKDRGKPGRADVARVKATLDELVEQEAMRQAAVAARLDEDADYQKRLRFMEAPLVQFQREELTDRYLKRELVEKSAVDEAEARNYFDAHATELKSEYHVAQILVPHDEAKIRDLKKKIVEGMSFEDAAATLFPAKLPEGTRRPWDLGVLRWSELPSQWREPLSAMKEGDVSDVIAGPKERFWIVKLVERKTQDAIRFEQVKADIAEILQGEKRNGLAQKIKDSVRKKASVVLLREPGAMPEPHEPD